MTNKRWLLALVVLGISLSQLFRLANADDLVPRAYLPVVMRQVTGTTTPTPTVTATPSSTATPSATPENLLTSTMTPTPPCLVYVVDPVKSYIQVQNSPTWSDNESLLTILVFLLDNCGISIADNRPVTLSSSRPLSDTITAPNPNAVPIAPGIGIYQFTVRSNTVGTSAFTATVGSLLGGTGPIVAVTGTNNQGNFVCVTGMQSQGANPRQLAINYTNPAQPSVSRRLVGLQANWATISGSVISNTVQSIAFGSSTNVIWSGAANSPVNIGLVDWQSVFRSMASSSTRTLMLNFANHVSPPVGSQWRYTFIATWDNGFNSSFCTSPPVVITLP